MLFRSNDTATTEIYTQAYTLPLHDALPIWFEAFQNSLLSYPEIQNVSASTAIPGRQPGWNAGGIRRIGEGDDVAKQYRILGIDYDFVETFQLKLVAGRDFAHERKTDRSAVLFNESAIRTMGFKTPAEALDEKIFFRANRKHIVNLRLIDKIEP